MNPAQVLDVIARLEVAYRTELTDPERRLWLEELEPFDADIVAAAAEDRITSSSPFMPKVGEIMQAVRDAIESAPRRGPTPLELPAGEYVQEMPAEVRDKVHELVNRTVDDETAWERAKADFASSPRLVGVCSGAGQAAVDGKCPGCGEPLP